MSRQDAKNFIRNAISLAMFRDNSSGGIIRLMDVTAKGYQREVITFENLAMPNSY